MGVIFLFGQKIWPILGYFWGGTPKNAQKPPKMAKMRAKTLKNGSTLSSKMHFSLRSTLYISMVLVVRNAMRRVSCRHAMARIFMQNTFKNGSTLSSKMHFSLRSTLYIRVGVLCAQCNETSLMSPCNGAYFYAKYVQKRVDAVI